MFLITLPILYAIRGISEFFYVEGIVSCFVIGLILGLTFGRFFGLVYGLVLGSLTRHDFELAIGFGFMLGYFTGFFSVRKLLPLLKELPKVIKQTINGLIHQGQLKDYPVKIAIASFIIIYMRGVHN